MLVGDARPFRRVSSTPPHAPAKRLAAFLLRASGAIALAGSVRRLLRGPRLVVLCYHRISEEAGLPAVSAAPEEFKRQAAWLGHRFEVLTLDGVAAYLKGSLKLRRDAVALTFDDGYEDNFHCVLPLLRKHNLPAAFFISSGPLLRRTPYWYDLLWSRLSAWNGAALPEGLSSRLPKEFTEAWNSHAASPDTFRRQRVVDAAKSLDRDCRQALLGALRVRLKSGSRDPECATMSPEEARAASAQGITLGAHTRTHPSLGALGAEECAEEIAGSIEDMASHGIPVRHFAYPFGTPADTGGPRGLPRAVLASLPEGRGITLAVTTEERAVSQDDDPLLVPRKVITLQTLSQIAFKLEHLAWQIR